MKNQFDVTFDKVEYPCFFIEDKDEAELVIRKLVAKGGILAADLETGAEMQWKHIPTAALSPHLSSPRLLQMFTGTGVVVIDLWKAGNVDWKTNIVRDPIDLKTIFDSRPSVFHNIAFDYKMLRKHYGVIDPDIHCTCIMARLVWHALFPEKKAATLKATTIAIFGEEINKKAGGSDWSVKELTFEQIKYSALDAIVEMKIYEKLDNYIDELKLRPVYELYRKAQLALCEMELNGVCFDSKHHINNVVKWREQLIDAKEEALAMTKMKTLTAKSLADWLTENLPEETLIIWPRTDKGQLKTDADTFSDFDYLDIAAVFSRFQKAKTLTSSYGMKMIDLINPATNRLHPGYMVSGAGTGRLSCSSPNIQQAPRDKTFRATFIPSPGYEMVVLDYSQVEVRCIAEMSGDETMIKVYEEGMDLYKYTASVLTGRPYKSIGDDDPDRQKAKALVLGLNYGLGEKKYGRYAKKNYKVELEEGEAGASIKAYRKLYHVLRTWQLHQVDMCPVRKYTVFSKMGKSRKLFEDRFYGVCMNHPIQGTCAEIMLSALAKARMYLRGTSARLLASVHDEILVECLPEDTDSVKELLTKAMMEAYIELLPSGRTTRNLLEALSGCNWADAKTKKPKVKLEKQKHSLSIL